MSIKRENLQQHELIGLQVEIIDGKDPDIIEKKGVIMNETKNTITIEENEELKTIPKEGANLSVTLPKGEKVKMKGKKLVARPEDRTKKFR